MSETASGKPTCKDEETKKDLLDSDASPTATATDITTLRKPVKKRRAILNSNRFCGTKDSSDGVACQLDEEPGKCLNQFKKTINKILNYIMKKYEALHLFELVLRDLSPITLTESPESNPNASRGQFF